MQLFPKAMSDDEELFEVNEVINKRRNPSSGYTEYLVRWKGYSSKYDTWEPLANLTSCKDVIQRYNENLKKRSPNNERKPEAKRFKESATHISSVVKIKSSSNLSKARARFHKNKANAVNSTKTHATAKPSSNSLKVTITAKPTITRTMVKPVERKQPPQPQKPKTSNAAKNIRTALIKQNNNGSRPSSRCSSPIIALEDLASSGSSPIPFIDHDYILSKTEHLLEKPDFSSLRTRNFKEENGFDSESDIDVMNTSEQEEKISKHKNFDEKSELGVIAEFIDIGTVKIDPSSQLNKLNQRKTTLRNKTTVKHVFIIKRASCTEIILANEAYENSLTTEILNELKDAFISVAEDEKSSVVLFGTVGQTFCSGMCLKYLLNELTSSTNQMQTAKLIAKTLRDFVNVIIDFSKPIVAVVQGKAIGLGCALLPLFDCVYASERASFQLPYAAIGQGPEGCSSYLFPKTIGLSAANDMLLNSHAITALEAKSLGLVVEVYCHDSLRRNLIPNLKCLTDKSATVLISTKALLRNPDKAALKHSNQYEYQVLRNQWSNEDILAKITNFIITNNQNENI